MIVLYQQETDESDSDSAQNLEMESHVSPQTELQEEAAEEAELVSSPSFLPLQKEPKQTHPLLCDRVFYYISSKRIVTSNALGVVFEQGCDKSHGDFCFCAVACNFHQETRVSPRGSVLISFST